jgi:hypothetical protein
VRRQQQHSCLHRQQLPAVSSHHPVTHTLTRARPASHDVSSSQRRMTTWRRAPLGPSPWRSNPSLSTWRDTRAACPLKVGERHGLRSINLYEKRMGTTGTHEHGMSAPNLCPLAPAHAVASLPCLFPVRFPPPPPSSTVSFTSPSRRPSHRTSFKPPMVLAIHPPSTHHQAPPRCC